MAKPRATVRLESSACLGPSSTPTLPTRADFGPSSPPAIAAGYQSVHAFPMGLRDQVIGALNLFGSEDHRFDPDEVRVVQALADIATIGLLQQRSIANAEGMTEQLQFALNSRIVIEQAKGAFAQLNDISVDEAFRRLRQEAHTSRRKLTEVCAEVLERR